MSISNHAKIRIRDRCGLKKKAAEKLVENALKKGISHSETKGSLNRYITSLYFYNQSANNIRIYNNIVFIFSNNRLMTVLHLPNKYKNTVESILESRKEEPKCQD